ncbi:hypothetical protein [Nonomuraea jabiensis]|uniref:Uncharacterized protein n=1 Tax=Nonomuraea jabiensis TaxID=882448 RepID=A0A7W9LEB2_9ACTN|nr:hypothetical protein [Nonomuraea jabiensis]MBB5780644.1 hypothetical protein [Nonomuraea jabiensis]
MRAGPAGPRRMLCDTAVHHYDAAATTGAAFGIADDLAAEVITEGMEMPASPGSESLKPSLVELRGRGERPGYGRTGATAG